MFWSCLSHYGYASLSNVLYTTQRWERSELGLDSTYITYNIFDLNVSELLLSHKIKKLLPLRFVSGSNEIIHINTFSVVPSIHK